MDIEWLLSTLFDASLLNFRAAANGGSFFICFHLCHFGPSSAALVPSFVGHPLNYSVRKPHADPPQTELNALCNACWISETHFASGHRLPTRKTNRGRPATMTKSSHIERWTARHQRGNAVRLPPGGARTTRRSGLS